MRKMTEEASVILNLSRIGEEKVPVYLARQSLDMFDDDHSNCSLLPSDRAALIHSQPCKTEVDNGARQWSQ